MPASETLSSRRFDKIANNFATSEVHRSSPTMAALHETLGPQTGSAICDVACGAGHLALSFAEEYPARLVGVDPAPSMLESFRGLAAERQVTVETAQAVAEELPFPDASFDLVVSRLAPHHFQDMPKAVGEMTRLLRPGGRLAVIDLEGHTDPVIDALNHELEILHDPTHVRSYTLDEWVEFFQGAGLNVPVARGGQAESRTGVPVKRWCEIASSGAEAEAAIRRRLAEAPEAHREALGIRQEGEEFFIPVRTCMLIGVKPLSGVR
ncbi:Methyltransferase type 11 [Streptomyces davaonensis JCM 4913]|uniref:Methyltransferase type 11 n=1 Tax=Streptomyces davaonensis (strain DSM 101723 / JCM 4913 / KCC S-0913 / 768) TaxID=1214101 RepID=K4QZY4_STRDJ|nr:methyltransferase domain-containing protein [Streptomyces davaonensis]CCK26390.1 Methyltransferase type 11 [Streptomyces davaonensis JCM 4913]